MIQGNENVGVHDGTANLCFRYIVSAFHGNEGLVRALQPIADEDVTAGGKGGKSIDIGALYMIESIFPTAHI